MVDTFTEETDMYVDKKPGSSQIFDELLRKYDFIQIFSLQLK